MSYTGTMARNVGDIVETLTGYKGKITQVISRSPARYEIELNGMGAYMYCDEPELKPVAKFKVGDEVEWKHHWQTRLHSGKIINISWPGQITMYDIETSEKTVHMIEEGILSLRSPWTPTFYSIKCECGSDSVKDFKEAEAHSTWCPLYRSRI